MFSIIQGGGTTIILHRAPNTLDPALNRLAALENLDTEVEINTA
jgi:hypothetical protein